MAKDIKAGDSLSADHVKSVRPSHGLHPKYYDEILGKAVLKDLNKGDRLSLSVIDDD